MSKTSKKRSKAYRGADAAPKGPRITRYSVSDESKFKEWWKDNKRTALTRLALGGAALLVSWVIYSLIW